MLVESDCLLLKEKICMDSDTKKATLKQLIIASFGAKAGLKSQLKQLKYNNIHNNHK
ncbi:hypothetical protein AC520_3099 [Enterobacter sp. OLF]|nr:hypothetical protein AC520_3099 [Enterobacter sp. OLF]